MTCPAQTPASVGLGQRGTAFQPDIGSPRSAAGGRPVVLVAARVRLAGLLALFGEHDRPAVEWKPSALRRRAEGAVSVLNGDVSAGSSSELRLSC